VSGLTNDGVTFRSLLPGFPLVESPFFEEITKHSSFDAETLHIAKALNKDGIAVFRFPDAEFDERADRIKAHLVPRFDFFGWRASGCKSGMRIADDGVLIRMSEPSQPTRGCLRCLAPSTAERHGRFKR
jgi:hypothetical protein